MKKLNYSIHYIFAVGIIVVLGWGGMACTPTTSDSLGSTDMMGRSTGNRTENINGDLAVKHAAVGGYLVTELLDVAPSSSRPTRNLPRDVKRAIQQSGFPVYSGSNPPSIEGWYDVFGTTQQVYNIPSIGPGMQITAQNSIWNQSGNTLNFIMHYNSDPGQTHITGSGNNFTMYMKINYYNNPNCPQWALISGTKNGSTLNTTLLRVNATNCVPDGFGWVTISYDWTYLGTPRTTIVP